MIALFSCNQILMWDLCCLKYFKINQDVRNLITKRIITLLLLLISFFTENLCYNNEKVHSKIYKKYTNLVFNITA